MGRKSNSLFIGREHMTIDGANVKHPALINRWATVNVGKISKDPIDLIGLDIETDSETGFMKLLGEWNKDRYVYSLDRFLERLFLLVKYASHANKSLAYWSKLDPFVIFKEFLIELPTDEERKISLNRFGEVSGTWNKKTLTWDVRPVIEIKMDDGYYFGIQNMIRSATQFYVRQDDEPELSTVWAYDIKGLYQKGLEKEATSRFNWYSKIALEAHIIDWEKFDVDEYYRDMVLESNKLDARAAYALGMSIQEDFKKAFEWYPRTLISQGSLARAAVTAVTWNTHAKDTSDEKKLSKLVSADLKSIGIVNYEEEWNTTYGEDTVKEIYAIASEAYSGGNIEAYGYGAAKKVSYADIASAYPGVAVTLKDLRGAKIARGEGLAPVDPNAYTFIRGVVTIPESVDYSPITIKHPVFTSTNIRPVGTFRASYIQPERDLMIKMGATFKDETWVQIRTKGKLSVIAKATDHFVKLRERLIALNDSAQFMAKIAANSIYGITFEAVPTHHDVLKNKIEIETYGDDFYKEAFKGYKKHIDLRSIKSELEAYLDPRTKEFKRFWSMWHSANGMEPEAVVEEIKDSGIHFETYHASEVIMEMDRLYKMTSTKQEIEYQELDIEIEGYRAGEFFNPIYAAYITGVVRCQLNEALWHIKKNGGQPILTMTDSIFWVGGKELLPDAMWRKKKTLGYFEEPKEASEMICLGTGRYGYKNDKGEWETKRRGLNAVNFKDVDGIVLDQLNWRTVVQKSLQSAKMDVDLEVRVLVSPGMIRGNHNLTWRDLGRVMDVERNVMLTVGHSKRLCEVEKLTPKRLLETLTWTKSIVLEEDMFNEGVYDGTYPNLRRMMNEKPLLTRKGKRRYDQRKYKKKQSDDPKTKERWRETYRSLKDAGFTAEEASKYCRTSIANIQRVMQERLRD